MSNRIFGSVCSGIEAASVAWNPLGWEAEFFAEIDPFPSAVLAHHYPETPNLGDFTKIQRTARPISLLVGGTPCQSFSVAGLRGGMDDARGVLALEFLRLADRLGPAWVVWENVPGVLSSNGGRDFGAFLGGLAELGYGWAYRVLDAQYFGVPQRRRRVFVVGRLGDWRGPAAVLFEQHSLSGDPTPRRETRERFAGSASYGISPDCFDRSGEPASGLAADRCGLGVDEELAYALRAKRPGGVAHVSSFSSHGYGQFREGLGMVTARDAKDGFHSGLIAHTLRGNGYDASEDGTGRGTPIIPIDLRQASRGEKVTNFRSHGSGGPPGVGVGQAGDPAFTVSERGQAIAFNPQAGGKQTSLGYEPGSQTTGTLSVCQTPAIAGSAVRRLTPLECERLQGFPDHYTAVPYRGKPAADGNRYKALGNSMAVPVMRWIGQRIDLVSDLMGRSS